MSKNLKIRQIAAAVLTAVGIIAGTQNVGYAEKVQLRQINHLLVYGVRTVHGTIHF